MPDTPPPAASAPPPARTRLTLGLALAAVAAFALAEAVARLTDVPDLDSGDQKKTAQYLLHASQTGEWLLPREQGTTLPTKPPLFVWLGLAAGPLAGGPTDLALRLPSALAGLVLAVLTVLTAEMLAGTAAGLAAGLAVAGNYLFFRLAGFGRPDMALCAFITLACWAFVRLRLSRGNAGVNRAVFWTSLALGTLTKGPVAAVIPLLAVTVSLAWRGGLRGFRALRPALGIPIFLLVAGGWLAAAVLRGGHEVFDTMIGSEVVQRVLDPQARGAVSHEAHYFLGEFAGRFLPWTLLLPAALIAAFPALREARRRSADRRGPDFPTAWLAGGLAFFLLWPNKRADYAMAIVPPAAILVGMLLAGPLASGTWGKRLAVGGAAVLVAAGFSAVLVAGDGMGTDPSLAPRILPAANAAALQAHGGAVLAGALAAALLSVASVWLLVLGRGVPAAFALAGVFALAGAGERFAFGGTERERLRARREFLLETAAGARRDGFELRACGPGNSAVLFYLGQARPALASPGEVRAEAARAPGGRLRLVAGARAAEQLLAAGVAVPAPGNPSHDEWRVLEAAGR